MKLYSYWRSTTSYRVRAALNLKELPYDTVPVDLREGAQHGADFGVVNPGRAVPVLVLEDGTKLTQSLAILDYLDAIAEPRLLPFAPVARAKVLAAAHSVAMDMHPIGNLRVLQKLQSDHNVAAQDWMRHWMRDGFTAVEAQLREDTEFAFGDAPDLADLCITAQAYNAHRWGVDLTAFPKVSRVEQACLAVPAIAAAHPDRQPDAATMA